LKEKFKKDKFRSLRNKKVDPKTSKEYQGLRGGGVAKTTARIKSTRFERRRTRM
jgi:hypothetical protein